MKYYNRGPRDDRWTEAAIGLLLALLIALALFAPWKAHAADLALGDSLAVGFGQASHLPTNAKVGIGSCAILRRTPSAHYDFVLLSAGTNDPPGRCIEAIRARLNASRVVWVVPVNGARSHVLAVAGRYGDTPLFYTPGDARGLTRTAIGT